MKKNVSDLESQDFEEVRTFEWSTALLNCPMGVYEHIPIPISISLAYFRILIQRDNDAKLVVGKVSQWVNLSLEAGPVVVYIPLSGMLGNPIATQWTFGFCLIRIVAWAIATFVILMSLFYLFAFVLTAVAVGPGA